MDFKIRCFHHQTHNGTIPPNVLEQSSSSQSFSFLQRSLTFWHVVVVAAEFVVDTHTIQRSRKERSNGKVVVCLLSQSCRNDGLVYADAFFAQRSIQA